MAIDWLTVLSSPLALVIIACIIVTVTVILVYAVKVKNKFIDFLWTGLLITGIGIAFRFGLLELIPAMPENPLLDTVIYVGRWLISAFGMIFISKPTKIIVDKIQGWRADYNSNK